MTNGQEIWSIENGDGLELAVCVREEVAITRARRLAEANGETLYVYQGSDQIYSVSPEGEVEAAHD